MDLENAVRDIIGSTLLKNKGGVLEKNDAGNSLIFTWWNFTQLYAIGMRCGKYEIIDD
jgi:hypothetical protein